MSGVPHRKPIFEFTAKDSAAIAMIREGRSVKEMVAAGFCVTRIYAAIDRDRLRILLERDKTTPGAVTTLHQARRGKSTVVDVRRGKWKNPLD